MYVTGYSYIRFSSKGKQAHGDSFRRQMEWAPAVCTKEGWTLDASLTLHDLGVSAFRGTNAATGALAAFLSAIGKQVKPGRSILLIESLDRLTRQDIDAGWELFRSILKAGVQIRTREPEQHYRPEDLKSFETRVMVQAYLLRGYNESQTKSMRGNAFWKRVRDNREMKGPKPAWLGKPEAVTAIRYICRQARRGQGIISIVRQLNTDGTHKPFGKRPYWSRSYVAQLLNDRRLMGEWQPCRLINGKSIPEGPPIPNHFPAVLTEDEWYAMRASVSSRGKKGRGREGKDVANLFTGLIFDARDGERMHLGYTSGSRSKPNSRCIQSHVTKNCLGKRPRFPYSPLEALLLQTLSELNPADLDPQSDPVAPLEGKLADIDVWIAKVQARLDAQGPTDELLDTLTRYSKQRKAIVEELEAARMATVPPSTLADAQGLIAKAKDPDTRRHLKTKIRSLVDSIWVLVVDDGSTDRYAHIQMFFKSGTMRSLMAHWRRKGKGKGQVDWYWQGEGDADKRLTLEFDLRLYRENAHELTVHPHCGILPLIRP